jgi:hypothetical protein
MNTIIRTIGAFLILGLGAGLTTSGCGGEAGEEIDNTVDCAQICNRYQDCFDSSYDVSSCTDTCEDNADVNQDFENKKEACDSCIDDKACAESFPCANECGGIVP